MRCVERHRTFLAPCSILPFATCVIIGRVYTYRLYPEWEAHEITSVMRTLGECQPSVRLSVSRALGWCRSSEFRTGRCQVGSGLMISRISRVRGQAALLVLSSSKSLRRWQANVAAAPFHPGMRVES